METIIVKPKTPEESEQVLRLLAQVNIEAEVYRDRTDEEILDSIERGAKEARDYLDGKIQLKDAQSLLDEL